MRSFVSFLFFILILSSCATMKPSNSVSPENYMELANGYAGLSKYEMALTFYSQAQKYPDYRNAAEYGMARMYAFLGKWDESVLLLKTLLQRDPENMIVASALAYALAAKGEVAEASLLYHDLYEKNADDPESGLAYAKILLLCKNYQDVLDLSLSLREKFPESSIISSLVVIEKKATDALVPPEKVVN